MIINQETIKQELDRLDDSQLLQVAHLITALQSQEKLTQPTAKNAALPATQPYRDPSASRPKSKPAGRVQSKPASS